MFVVQRGCGECLNRILWRTKTNQLFSLGSAKGVNKIYKFDQKNPPQRRSIIVYMISSNLHTFKYVLDQIHSINSSHQQQLNGDKYIGMKPFHVIVLPTVLHSFEIVLEEEGLFGVVELHRFNWDFITIDGGVLSLEMPQVFREVFVREDTSLLSSLANSLRILNMVCRRPKTVITFGENAAKIVEMIEQMGGFQRPEMRQMENSDFSAMIVIDRNKDYASSLMTPVTYSGLLLELFRSVAGTLQIDDANNRIQAEKLLFLKIKPKTKEAPKPSTEAATNLRLTASADSIYHDNRYKHFADAINLLGAQAKALGMEGQSIQGMQINEMHRFVATKLPKVASQKKELFKHLILCESIVNELGSNFEQLQTMEESMLYNRNKKQTFQRIQEQLTTDGHRFNALRHVCLMHLTCGLNADECTNFMTNYLNAFGYQYLPVFTHLATAKLFPDLPTLAKTKILTNISLPKWQNQFQAEANKMKLLPAAASNEAAAADGEMGARRDPVCSSYVFNGTYIPVIAQLANVLLTANRFDEFAEKFGHSEQIVLHDTVHQTKICAKEAVIAHKRGEYTDIFPLKPRTLFVFVVGGVTYAEIAACNFVERITGSKIIVSSNCIASGGDIIEAAFT